MRKIREMMESCSHTEYRQSFYLTLHSEGLLFHGPPYLILLLPPRLPLLLVRKPLLGNLAVEKRRRVKTEARGYHESLQGTGIHSSPSSVPPEGTAQPWPGACSTSAPCQHKFPLAREEWGCWPWRQGGKAGGRACSTPHSHRNSPNNQGILLRAYLQVIITCWSIDKAVMENMRRSSCQDHKFAGIKQKKNSMECGFKKRKEERKKGKSS